MSFDTSNAFFLFDRVLSRDPKRIRFPSPTPSRISSNLAFSSAFGLDQTYFQWAGERIVLNVKYGGAQSSALQLLAVEMASSAVKRSVHWDANPTSTPAKTGGAGAQGSSSSVASANVSNPRGSSLDHFQPWTSAHSISARGSSNSTPNAAPMPSATAVRAPTYGKSVLKSRMKWNGTALLALSMVERLPLTRRLWW